MQRLESSVIMSPQDENNENRCFYKFLIFSLADLWVLTLLLEIPTNRQVVAKDLRLSTAGHRYDVLQCKRE